MKIKLNVSRLTFQKYLIELNYSYRILQYDDFILSIKRQIKKRIKDYFLDDNLKEGVQNIFGDKYIPVLALGYDEEITYISSGFLISLIEEGSLDLFFKEKRKFIPSLKIREMIYIKEKYGDLKVRLNLTSSLFYKYINKKEYENISYKNAVINGNNKLSLDEKEEVENKIKEFITARIINNIYGVPRAVPFKKVDISILESKIKESKVITNINILENNISDIQMKWSEETSTYLNTMKEVFDILKIRSLDTRINLIEDFKEDSFWEKNEGRNSYRFNLLNEYRYFLQKGKEPSYKNDYVRIIINENAEDIAISELI